MARKLKGFAGAEPAAAIADKPEGKPAPAPETKVKWLPLPLDEDGNPDTSKLPPPVFKEKVRIYNLEGGEQYAKKETVFVKAGEPRYSVSPKGEVIAWYKKRGGIGRKLVFQFKAKYRQDEKGRARQLRETNFRSLLRQMKVPGA
jgi:hypothetical protein